MHLATIQQQYYNASSNALENKLARLCICEWSTVQNNAVLYNSTVQCSNVNGLENHLFVIALVIDILGQ